MERGSEGASEQIKDESACILQSSYNTTITEVERAYVVNIHRKEAQTCSIIS